MTKSNHAVELRNVVKRYGDFTAVHPMNLPIEEGSFVTLLGPSGCGKTTTLRMIAGLETLSEGDLLIKGRRVNDVPIHKRNLGIVFQNYALFPHKTIFDNVAFGLKYRRVDKATITQKVREALELVQLPQMEKRLPSQLSGGQQQRIAMARAIVIEPDVLLLDEPLSALDANLRENMRVELKRIQHKLGVTTIFVTHDQAEALAMSDKVIVMSHGRIEQSGTPEEVYNHPASEFVASFLGNSNFFDGRAVSVDGNKVRIRLEGGVEIVAEDEDEVVRSVDEAVRLVIRAEKVFVAKQHERTPEASVLDATVDAVDYQGLAARYFLSAGPLSFQAINPIEGHPFAEGDRVQLRIRAKDCVLLNKEAQGAA